MDIVQTVYVNKIIVVIIVYIDGVNFKMNILKFKLTLKNVCYLQSKQISY